MINSKKSVLVVDDSVLIMERMIQMLLETENIQFVIPAGNFKEAVRILDELSPDMVLLDIHLPDKSGIELLRMIKEKNESIIVVMITNNPNEYYREICRRLGAKYFFDKSEDFSMISDVMSAQMGS